MSDIIFAMWMLGSAMVGAAIGTVVMSVLAASRRADEDAEAMLVEYTKCLAENINHVTRRHCPQCKKVTTLNRHLDNLCCPHWVIGA